MKFTYQPFWTKRDGKGEAYGRPTTMDHSSVDEARKYVGAIVRDAGVQIHAVTLAAEDGKFSETWFEVDGQWKSINTGTSYFAKH